MNQFKVKIKYKDGLAEEKILDSNAIEELKQSIKISEDFRGRIPDFMEIVSKL